MSDASLESRYSTLSDDSIRELLGWMNMAAISTYRNDEGTVFNDQYYAFWEHYRFLRKYAESKGISSHARGCPRGLAHMSFTEVSALYAHEPSTQNEVIILDRPLMKYTTIAYKSKHCEIHFLCGHSHAHLIRILREFGIKHRFLNIPVINWGSWRSRPEYKGDK